MKYFFFCLLFIPFILNGQDKKVTALPEDTIVHTTDILYVIDQGSTSKKMLMSTLQDSIKAFISDSTRYVQQNLGDTAEALRGLALGTSAWSKTGTVISAVSTNDSVGIGNSDPTEKLHVTGNARATGNLIAGTALYLGSSAIQVSKYFDELRFIDVSNPSGVSLSDLVGTTLWERASMGYGAYTLFPENNNSYSYHLHVGGSATTTYNFKVTGNSNFTDMMYLDSRLYFKGTATYGNYIQANNSDTLYFTDESGTYKLSELASGGSGTGVVDTSGGQDAYGVAYFTDANTLDSDSKLQYSYSTLKIANSTNDTGLYISNSSTGNGIYIYNNGATGNGIYVANQSAGGNGINASTGLAGPGILATSSGVGTALYASGTSTGTIIYIYTGSTTTGDALTVTSSTQEFFVIEKDGDIMFPNFGNANDTNAVILLGADGIMDTATIVDASWQLKKTPLFLKYFFNRYNKELNWPRWEGDSYHDLNAMYSSGQLQAGIERAYVWIFRRDIIIFFLFVIIGWLGFNQYRINKRLKRCEKL